MSKRSRVFFWGTYPIGPVRRLTSAAGPLHLRLTQTAPDQICGQIHALCLFDRLLEVTTPHSTSRSVEHPPGPCALADHESFISGMAAAGRAGAARGTAALTESAESGSSPRALRQARAHQFEDVLPKSSRGDEWSPLGLEA